MPKQVDHDQRRHEIATATWLAIDDLGVEGTTMRAIADKAGCTTGRLNHYFDSREDVLLAALRHAHLQAAQRMTAVLDGKAGRDALRAVLLEALPLDDLRRTEWRVWLTFWAQAITNDSLQREHQRRYREWRDLVETLVGDIAADRPRADVTQIADTLLALVDGIGIHTSVTPGSGAARRARRTIDGVLDQLLPFA